MCCNFPTIKITEGNAFTLIFPLKRRSYVAERPIDEDIDVTRLTDVRVMLGGVEYAPTIETYGVRIDVPATLARGTYDGLLTADYDGNAIRGAYESCVQIVAWNAQSNAQQYILGSPVATKAAYVLGYMPTDAEVEELKQQLREQIAAAEQAEAEALAEKERYAEAVEQLDDLARQGDNPNATNTQILYDVNHLVVPPPTGMALESTLTAGITALQNAITALYGGDLTATLSALKTAIAEISIDTDDLAKADALADVQSDIDALQVLVGTTADTSTDATIFGKFAAVLVAVAGITGYATPTDVRNAQTAIIAAMPSVSGLATETNATSNKQAILDAISALSIPTVQEIQNGLAVDSTVAKEATLTDATNGLPAIKSLASSAATDAAAAKTAAQGITGYALQGSGNATQTDIASAIGTPATGQPSTLFAAIAAGGGGGGGGGDAQESTSQAILAAVKNNDTTTLAELLNSTHGLTAIQSLLNGVVNTYPYAKEANATQNKTDVISAVNGAMYVNFLANGIQAMADAELVVVPDGGQAESVTMDANKLYVFQNRTSDLTISFGTPTANIVNEYHMLLTVGAIPTITMPNSVVWAYSQNPLSGLISGRTYEIGILYNSGSVYFAIFNIF